MSDRVTQAPMYNGQSFIATTNGSKFSFSRVLSQEWEVMDGDVTCKVTYLIAFASKCTSCTEEWYILFLLNFAALKFALDEYDSIIYSQPIELEMDCKVLADLLGNNKLNLTHEQWRESVIARNIIVVWHKPGVENGCVMLSHVCSRLDQMKTQPLAATPL